MTIRVFFQPVGGWVGDVIPVVEEGVFRLFYLHEDRATPSAGMPWHRVDMSEVGAFEPRGVALVSGGAEAPDFNVYTGSVVRSDDGVHHLFYTGQNPAVLGADGRSLQVVMHATSRDSMATWHKHPEDAFGATAGYETGDWRDPFVFRDEESGMWRMLVTARRTSGADRRRGVIAHLVSSDLTAWQPAEPFWDPGRYIAMECPEVFRWGGWWYLVYSEFNDAFVTRYRMARSLNGPWHVPEHDSLDGRAFYAAKSAERDGRRLFFGWIATREGARDDGPWQWAGTLSVLEAAQRANGELAFAPPPETAAVFSEELPVSFGSTRGTPLRLAAEGGFASVVTDDDLPDTFRLSVELEIEPGTTECGVVLRAGAHGDEGYVIRLEPKRRRMVFDRWPRRVAGGEQWQVSGDVPFLLELERPCHVHAGINRLDVVVAGTICVATLNDEVVLSSRMYDREGGGLALFAGEGAVTVQDVRVTVPSEPLTDPTAA